MSYDRIIVPLDGSQLAEYILPHVETMVRSFHSELTLLHIVDTTGAAEGELTQSQKDARADITRYLEKVSKALTEKDVQSEWCICYGKPDDEIIRHAAENYANLIMMSTHGEGGVNGKARIGSVSMAVVSSGEVPVMLIRPSGMIAAR